MQALFIAYWVVATFTLGCALFYGAAPERVAAATLVLGSSATWLHAQVRIEHAYFQPEWTLLVIDAAVFGVLVVLALQANRNWPLWACAMQSLSVAGHLARIAQASISPAVYAWMTALWAWVIFGLILTGTYRHRTRLRQYGVDRSWSRSSSPL